MSQLSHRSSRRRFWRSLLILIGLFLSLSSGVGLAQSVQPIGTVDPIAPKYQRGQELYLKNCASCHIGLPPAVLPTQTWADLIQDPEHYGVQLPTIAAFDLRQIDQYLTTYSRSLREDESTPYRVGAARHFRALHPQVDLPKPLTIGSCASCHPKADVFNFRELSGN
jgi:Dihaem cytochrome c